MQVSLCTTEMNSTVVVVAVVVVMANGLPCSLRCRKLLFLDAEYRPYDAVKLCPTVVKSSTVVLLNICKVFRNCLITPHRHVNIMVLSNVQRTAAFLDLHVYSFVVFAQVLGSLTRYSNLFVIL